MGTLLLSILAGTLTTLSPCVLPILPLVLFGAMDQHRRGPLALAGGMVTSFVGFGLLAFGAGSALDISAVSIRNASAVMLLAFGVILLSTLLQQRFALAAASMTGSLQGALQRFTPQGLWGQFALGAMLGALWSPCSGPTLGAAVTLAAESETLGRAAVVMLFFGIGACLPLVALAYGSRQTLMKRRAKLAEISRAAKPALGAILLLTGVLVLSGYDKKIEAVLTAAMPDWLVGLTTRF